MKLLFPYQEREFLITVLTRLHWSFFISFWWDCIGHSWFHVHVLIGNITVEATDEMKHSLVKKVSKAFQTKSQGYANLLKIMLHK